MAVLKGAEPSTRRERECLIDFAPPTIIENCAQRDEPVGQNRSRLNDRVHGRSHFWLGTLKFTVPFFVIHLFGCHLFANFHCAKLFKM